MQTIDKTKLIELIVNSLGEEAQELTHGAKEAYEEATDNENIAENKYDTRALEASYLAEAEADMADELNKDINIYKNLELNEFNDNTPIAVTALIELESDDGNSNIYFLGPYNGGTQVNYDDTTITIITPSSPIGSQLIGKSTGDIITFTHGDDTKEYEVIAVA